VKTTVKVTVSVGIAAALIVGLMMWGGVSPMDAIQTIASLPPEVYLLALGMHMCNYCLRALRFMLLIPAERRPTFWRALVVSGAHNMAAYVLPAKTGEASLIVYLRVQCGVPTTMGLASLLISRLLDGATLCCGLSIACLFLARSGRYEALEWLGSAGLTLMLLCLTFAVLSLRGELVIRLIARVGRWFRLHRWSFGSGLLDKANQLALALRSARGSSRLYLAALITLPVWLLVFGFYTVLAKSMGLPEEYTFVEATFGSALAVMFNLLPVNGMAGVGTQELGWVTGFSFLGVDKEMAMKTGIGCHLVQLFNVVVIGIVAHLAMGLLPRPGSGTTRDGNRP
jgi:uncharacterized protein (TIRG00374 family)